MGVFTQLCGAHEYEIVDEFMDHFEIMTATMAPTILALGHTDTYASSVDELFRTFHNLKSATAYLRLEAMNRLAATIEDQLESARSHPGPASEGFIDWLLMVSDQFECWHGDLSGDRERFTPLNFTIFDLPEIN